MRIWPRRVDKKKNDCGLINTEKQGPWLICPLLLSRKNYQGSKSSISGGNMMWNALKNDRVSTEEHQIRRPAIPVRL